VLTLWCRTAELAADGGKRAHGVDHDPRERDKYRDKQPDFQDEK
jgi:hypothetical protein